MIEHSDQRAAAIVRWIFGFMKFQFRVGLTLDEIEKCIQQEVDNGSFYEFVRRYDLEIGRILKEERNDKQ